MISGGATSKEKAPFSGEKGAFDAAKPSGLYLAVTAQVPKATWFSSIV